MAEGRLLMISRDICSLEVRGDFKLSRCHFIMMGFSRDTEPVHLVFKILHEYLNTLRDCAKVMVVKFLAFCLRCAKQRASGQQQVRTAIRKVTVNQKIFLLRTTT